MMYDVESWNRRQAAGSTPFGAARGVGRVSWNVVSISIPGTLTGIAEGWGYWTEGGRKSQAETQAG